MKGLAFVALIGCKSSDPAPSAPPPLPVVKVIDARPVDAAIPPDAVAAKAPPSELVLPAPSDRAIAGIDLHMSDAMVAKILGAPSHKTAPAHDEDTGVDVSVWTWADKPGLTVKLTGTADDDEHLVAEVALAPPSTLATTKKLHLGLTRDEVVKLAGKPDSDNKVGKTLEIVAYGTIDDSLLVDIDKGKVTAITRTPVNDAD